MDSNHFLLACRNLSSKQTVGHNLLEQLIVSGVFGVREDCVHPQRSQSSVHVNIHHLLVLLALDGVQHVQKVLQIQFECISALKQTFGFDVGSIDQTSLEFCHAVPEDVIQNLELHRYGIKYAHIDRIDYGVKVLLRELVRVFVQFSVKDFLCVEVAVEVDIVLGPAPVVLHALWIHGVHK